jgi:hypothetical protein
MSEPALQQEFWAAVGTGNSARARELASAGADVNLPIGNPGGETPLIRAIAAGDLVMVKLLLEKGADVNLPWKGPRSWTPLMFAHDNPEMLQELIVAGADLNARTTADWISLPSGRLVSRPGGQTTLHLAALEGNAEAVRTLLRAGAEVELKAEDGLAALDYAVKLGAVTESAEALVEAGAPLTPERLEAMHASAHSTESDLFVSPCLPDGKGQALAGVEHSLNKESGQPKATKPPTEFRCPQCHALIYSRKPKICGQCGALLPFELLLNDLQIQALSDERHWARELADKFSNQPSSTTQPQLPLPSRTISQDLDVETLSQQALLPPVSCSEEYKHRPRPAFWLYAIGYAILFFAIAFLPLKWDLLPPEVLLILTVAFIWLCFWSWHGASPLCPNCKQNIRICIPAHCHVCGKLLKNRRCEDCKVNGSSTSYFSAQFKPGNFQWITYCPGCGVRVDAKVGRWRLGR